mmetsp:Transcript_73610/g.145884  ORF Transcript_73610/g.145884 Transcript_73610/m.145884 type:complete len:325 (-) Transcript_73610:64-1038(-)
MNRRTLLEAMLALMVAVGLACALAQTGCTDDNCQTLGTMLLSLSRTLSSQRPSNVTKRTTKEAVLVLDGESRHSLSGESLLATNRTLSKVRIVVEAQSGPNPRPDVRHSDHETGPESFVQHARNEEILARHGKLSPIDTTAPRRLQSGTARVHQNVHRNTTSQVVREPFSSRGPWLQRLLPPLNLAGLASLWNHLRRNNGLGQEIPVSHIDERDHVVEAARHLGIFAGHKNSWLLIVGSVAFLLSIMLAWWCFFSQSGSDRPVGYDRTEYYEPEAWVMSASSPGKGSSRMALQPPNRSTEKANSSSPTSTRSSPSGNEPIRRLY